MKINNKELGRFIHGKWFLSFLCSLLGPFILYAQVPLFQWEDHKLGPDQKYWCSVWNGGNTRLVFREDPDTSSKVIGVKGLNKKDLITYKKTIRTTVVTGKSIAKHDIILKTRIFGPVSMVSHSDYWDQDRGKRGSVKLQKGDIVQSLDFMEGEEYGGRFEAFYLFNGVVFISAQNDTLSIESLPTINIWAYHSSQKMTGWFPYDEGKFIFHHGDANVNELE